jgi:hypothetical protein
MTTHPQRLEEPLVLSACVSVLKQLLDDFLSILSLRWLLEGIGSHSSLEAFELEGVASGEEVGVVDDLFFESSY